MSHENENLVMWSIGQIAERDNVSPPAVSKAVKKMIEQNPETPLDRDPRGRVSRISLAHYDHFRQRFVNPAKACAPIRTPSENTSQPLNVSSSFEEARRQAEWLKVGRERLRHQEAVAQLIRKDCVEEAVRVAGKEINAILSRFANRADDIVSVASKDGLQGARTYFKTMAFEVGNEIADRFAAIADAAPQLDPLIEDEVEL